VSNSTNTKRQKKNTNTYVTLSSRRQVGSDLTTVMDRKKKIQKDLKLMSPLLGSFASASSAAEGAQTGGRALFEARAWFRR